MRPLLFTLIVLFAGWRVTALAGETDADQPRVISFGDLSFAVMPPKQVEPAGASVPQPAYGDQIPERVADAFQAKYDWNISGDGTYDVVIEITPRRMIL